MKKSVLFSLIVSITFVPAARGAILYRNWRNQSNGSAALGMGTVGLLTLASYFTYKYFSAGKKNKLPDEEMQTYQVIGDLLEGLNSDHYDDYTRQQEIVLHYQELSEEEKESLKKMFKVETDELVVQRLNELYPMLIQYAKTLKKDSSNKTISLIGAIGCSSILIGGFVYALLSGKLIDSPHELPLIGRWFRQPVVRRDWRNETRSQETHPDDILRSDDSGREYSVSDAREASPSTNSQRRTHVPTTAYR